MKKDQAPAIMVSRQKIWTVIPAAGMGTRIGGEIPKQYLNLNGKQIIEYTLEKLAAHQQIAGIIVAISTHDRYWSNITLPAKIPVINVEGGSERHHSVLNALIRLAEIIQSNDWVLVHDAARPCIRQDDIDKLINAVVDHPVGGILGVPVSDTMKRVDQHKQIIDTVNRSGVWHAQTPQMFRLGSLIDAIKHAIASNVPVTDEAGAMELQGFSPLMVEGHKDNIKITEPQDLMHAAMYLEQQTRMITS